MYRSLKEESGDPMDNSNVDEGYRTIDDSEMAFFLIRQYKASFNKIVCSKHVPSRSMSVLMWLNLDRNERNYEPIIP